MASANVAAELLESIRDSLKTNPSHVVEQPAEYSFDEAVECLVQHVVASRVADKEPFILGKYEQYASASGRADVQELYAIQPTVQLLLKLFPHGVRAAYLQKVLQATHAFQSLRQEKKQMIPIILNGYQRSCKTS